MSCKHWQWYWYIRHVWHVIWHVSHVTYERPPFPKKWFPVMIMGNLGHVWAWSKTASFRFYISARFDYFWLCSYHVNVHLIHVISRVCFITLMDKKTVGDFFGPAPRYVFKMYQLTCYITRIYLYSHNLWGGDFFASCSYVYDPLLKPTANTEDKNYRQNGSSPFWWSPPMYEDKISISEYVWLCQS